MTTYTRQMLINEAWTNLFPSTGQSPEAEDADKISQKIDALLGELREREVVNIADVEDIPEQYFSALGELLANECAPAFAQPKNPQIREDAEQRLKIMSRSTLMRHLAVEPALLRRTGFGYSRFRLTGT